jgi:hypothetical protein
MTIGLAVASRAIELGHADIGVDQYQHQALVGLFRASSSSPEFRGYVWVVSHTHLDWLDHDGPAPNVGLETLEKVTVRDDEPPNG